MCIITQPIGTMTYLFSSALADLSFEIEIRITHNKLTILAASDIHITHKNII